LRGGASVFYFYFEKVKYFKYIMASIYTNILSSHELDYLNNHPEVISAKERLDLKQSGMVYFSVPITEVIHDTLQSKFGLNLPINAEIPMRWIKGDTAPHIDSGSSKFKNTFLVYLNDSPGQLVIDENAYPIQYNTGFSFNEGIIHKTQNTEHVPRLLLGPMNEYIQPVGRDTGIYYYSTQADAVNLVYNNELGGYVGELGFGGYGNYIIDLSFGYTSWRIASSSDGTSSQSNVYNIGNTLNRYRPDGNEGYYYLYPSNPCFLEGTNVLCQVDNIEKYVPVEQLKKGTLVKTILNGFKPVLLVGKGNIQNLDNDERTEHRLYKCCTTKYPDLKEDLYITGEHSILEFPITEKQKEDIIKHLGKLYVTDKKYRLMACLDERAEPWNSNGIYPIWHFALENDDLNTNYGVYVNGGLLVETCSINFLKNKSNMDVI